jgi:hypothetical protein
MYRARSIVPNRFDNREPAAFHVRIEDRRPAAGIDPPLDFRRLQARIDFGLQAHKVAGAVEVVEEVAERESHNGLVEFCERRDVAAE